MPTSENTHWTAVVYLCMCASVVLDLVFFQYYAKRLAKKNVSEMTCFVSSGM